MNHMASARCSRAGHGFLAQSWPYQQGLISVLTLAIMLLVGSSPSLAAHASARQVVAAPARSTTAATIPEALSTALNFNIFIIGDLNQRQAITYGRVAVGGNATLERYRIGDTLPRARDNRADLIVGGTLTFTNGLVAKGGVVVGGKTNLVGVGIPHGQVSEGLPINFGTQGAAMAEIATQLGQLPPNGTTQIRERRNARKQIMLIGTDPQINIFALAGHDMAIAQTLSISVPRGATVLLNIDGSTDQIKDIGFAIGTINRQFILYNFYQATDLTLNDDRIQGSILAPHARITFVQGRVNGTLIGATLTGTGVAWPAPFIGQLPMLRDTTATAGMAEQASVATPSLPTMHAAGWRRA